VGSTVYGEGFVHGPTNGARATMWKNMTWLAEEWRYWAEWRKMTIAARLEGKEDLPPRNSPFWYTFRWIGVGVALPVTVLGVLGILGHLLLTNDTALELAIYAAAVVAVVSWVLWILYSCISMKETGPHESVAMSRWLKTHEKKR